MQDSPSDRFAATAVLVKKASNSPWLDDSWSLLGTLPGLDEAKLADAEQQGELIYKSGLALQLYSQHSEAYYHNLTSQQPKIYLISSQSGDDLIPMQLTVDFDEAAAYMETSEVVLEAPLADELCVWLERFVMAHYRPTAPKRRQRTKWHNADGRSSL